MNPTHNNLPATSSFFAPIAGAVMHWTGRALQAIRGLSHQAQACPHALWGLALLVNGAAFPLIRAVADRLPSSAAARDEETTTAPSLLRPLFVGAASYALNSGLARLVHSPLNHPLLAAAAVSMVALDYFFPSKRASSPPENPNPPNQQNVDPQVKNSSESNTQPAGDHNVLERQELDNKISGPPSASPQSSPPHSPGLSSEEEEQIDGNDSNDSPNKPLDKERVRIHDELNNSDSASNPNNTPVTTTEASPASLNIHSPQIESKDENQNVEPTPSTPPKPLQVLSTQNTDEKTTVLNPANDKETPGDDIASPRKGLLPGFLPPGGDPSDDDTEETQEVPSTLSPNLPSTGPHSGTHEIPHDQPDPKRTSFALDESDDDTPPEDLTSHPVNLSEQQISDSDDIEEDDFSDDEIDEKLREEGPTTFIPTNTNIRESSSSLELEKKQPSNTLNQITSETTKDPDTQTSVNQNSPADPSTKINENNDIQRNQNEHNPDSPPEDDKKNTETTSSTPPTLLQAPSSQTLNQITSETTKDSDTQTGVNQTPSAPPTQQTTPQEKDLVDKFFDLFKKNK